ncbi:hypothetical protein WEI85_08175 [Actinomycetes bacterium KLBMP 9797]
MRSNTMPKAALWGAVALLVAGLTGCSSSEPGSASSASPSETASATAAAGNGQSGTTGGGSAVAWRGGEVRVPGGWRKAASADDFLCVLPAGGDQTMCTAPGHAVQDFLFLYASERKANREAPADPKTLDGSDMGFWMYNGGEVPCDDWSRNEKVDGAAKTVGGLQALYGKWSVTCASDGKSFVAQRWLLPKSRLGVVSYALTDQAATQIFQMVSTMNLSGYERSDTPTS